MDSVLPFHYTLLRVCYFLIDNRNENAEMGWKRGSESVLFCFHISPKLTGVANGRISGQLYCPMRLKEPLGRKEPCSEDRLGRMVNFGDFCCCFMFSFDFPHLWCWLWCWLSLCNIWTRTNFAYSLACASDRYRAIVWLVTWPRKGWLSCSWEGF